MNNRVIILYSNIDTKNCSPDNMDTIVQLREITAILEKNSYKVIPIPFTDSWDDLKKQIINTDPVFIFNLVETVKGTDKLAYLAAAFIEYLGYTYSGCPAWSLAALASKTSAKKILLGSNLPTADFFRLGDCFSGDKSGKWIVKSDTENASFGLDSKSIIDEADKAFSLLEDKTKTFGGSWFAERFISGREFNVSIIDDSLGKPTVLTPAEMTLGGKTSLGDKIVDYAAKWDEESPDYTLLTRSFDYKQNDSSLINKLYEISYKCWSLFELKGAARVDFRIDDKGNPWILEINANPCLSSDAGLAAAANYTGISHEDLIIGLIPIDRSI